MLANLNVFWDPSIIYSLSVAHKVIVVVVDIAVYRYTFINLISEYL